MALTNFRWTNSSTGTSDTINITNYGPKIAANTKAISELQKKLDELNQVIVGNNKLHKIIEIAIKKLDCKASKNSYDIVEMKKSIDEIDIENISNDIIGISSEMKTLEERITEKLLELNNKITENLNQISTLSGKLYETESDFYSVSEVLRAENAEIKSLLNSMDVEALSEKVRDLEASIDDRVGNAITPISIDLDRLKFDVEALKSGSSESQQQNNSNNQYNDEEIKNRVTQLELKLDEVSAKSLENGAKILSLIELINQYHKDIANDNIDIDEGTSSSIIQPNDDITIKAIIPVNEDMEIQAKSINANGFILGSAKLKITALSDIIISDISATGTKIGDSVCEFDSGANIILTGGSIHTNALNGIFIGNTSKPKNIFIDHVNFENISQYGIYFNSIADNATITITNCNFNDIQYPIYINEVANKFTLNIINCTLAEAATDEYFGLVSGNGDLTNGTISIIGCKDKNGKL